MRRTIQASLILASALLSCSPKDLVNTKPLPPEIEPLPEPPAQINPNNIFIIDYFSKPDTEGGFLKGISSLDIGNFIKEESVPKAALYMIDQVVFSTGKPLPTVKIAHGLKGHSFFAQNSAVSEKTEGTGIISMPLIDDYDGTAADGSYISGCSIPLHINLAQSATIYTMRLRCGDEIKKIYKNRSEKLKGEALIIGSISEEAKEDVKDYAWKGMGFRCLFGECSLGGKDIFVICNTGYACREIKAMSYKNIPYYKISIEKLKLQ